MSALHSLFDGSRVFRSRHEATLACLVAQLGGSGGFAFRSSGTGNLLGGFLVLGKSSAHRLRASQWSGRPVLPDMLTVSPYRLTGTPNHAHLVDASSGEVVLQFRVAGAWRSQAEQFLHH